MNSNFDFLVENLEKFEVEKMFLNNHRKGTEAKFRFSCYKNNLKK